MQLLQQKNRNNISKKNSWHIPSQREKEKNCVSTVSKNKRYERFKEKTMMSHALVA